MITNPWVLLGKKSPAVYSSPSSKSNVVSINQVQVIRFAFGAGIPTVTERSKVQHCLSEKLCKIDLFYISWWRITRLRFNERASALDYITLCMFRLHWCLRNVSLFIGTQGAEMNVPFHLRSRVGLWGSHWASTTSQVVWDDIHVRDQAKMLLFPQQAISLH